MLQQAAQGGGWVPIPGGVQEMLRCRTKRRFNEEIVVVGGWLEYATIESQVGKDLQDHLAQPSSHYRCYYKNYKIYLEVFSNLSDSMTLAECLWRPKSACEHSKQSVVCFSSGDSNSGCTSAGADIYEYMQACSSLAKMNR